MSPFPTAQVVTAMSGLVLEFCQMVLADADAVARFHMAAHELAENLAKYSTGNQVALEIELADVDGLCVLGIRARNEASPERLEEVRRRLGELNAASSAAQHYDQLMRDTAGIPNVSGLGLARLRAEAELHVDFAIAGNELTISVSAPVRPRQESTPC